jgi:hypothetical protein
MPVKAIKNWFKHLLKMIQVPSQTGSSIRNSSSWHMGTSHDNPTSSSSQYIEKGTWDGNRRISAGLTSRIAYEVALSEEWFFTPQFLFYVGLTEEFKDLSRTMRPYLEIGLARKLKQKTR